MYIKKLIILFLVILFTCFIGCSRSNAKGNKEDSVVLPIKKEIGNYIIEIEDTKLFKDYILYKYTLTAKDGSEIKDGDILLGAGDRDNTISFGLGGGEILRKKVSPNKVVVWKEYFIPAKRKDSIKIKYSIGSYDSNFNREDIKGPYLEESNENYDYINKRFSIDNMDLVLQSLGNFEFGSLIHFYVENIEDHHKISENYSIKIKSGNYGNIYKISPLIKYKELVMNDLASCGGYKKGLKTIAFYNCPLIYDNKKIDPNNIKIYLVNKETKVETLIYSK